MAQFEALPLLPGEPFPDSLTNLAWWNNPDGILKTLCHNAILATDVAFTITDPTRDDNPLIWVNPAFTRVTGYQFNEVIGRNCRFLQGPGTDPGCLDVLRNAIAAQQPVTVTMLNYRKDGTPFWNQLTMSPVFDGKHRLVSYVGVQTDVSVRVDAESERERAYEAERIARHDAETAHQRAAMLAEVTTRLAASLDVAEILKRLVHLIVPFLADVVVVDLYDEHGSVERTLSHAQSGLADSSLGDRLTAPGDLAGRLAPSPFLGTLEAVLVNDVATFDWQPVAASPQLHTTIDALGAVSMMYLPLVAHRGRLLASMTFFHCTRSYRPEDLAVALDIGRRAALTLDNARLYEHDHQVAVTLQRSLLPDLPPVADVAVAARYLPGDAQADVGGDFYELLALPDGSIGVAVGDVIGHDVAAAAAMGHLRGLLRACAWNSVQDGRRDPREVLDRVDQLVQGLHVVPLATLFYGHLERPAEAGGPWRFTYANAGHPPPITRAPNGTVRMLDDAPGVLLGVATKPRRVAGVAELPPGSILAAYTDGLIERRGEDLAHGLARVFDAVRRTPAEPEDLADAMVVTAGQDRDDDIAILVLKLMDSPVGAT